MGKLYTICILQTINVNFQITFKYLSLTKLRISNIQNSHQIKKKKHMIIIQV